MIRKNFFLLFILIACTLNAQENDPDIQRIRQRMDTIKEFSADVELKVDISFINMPNKFVKIHYTNEEPIKIHSEDFVLVPKRGLDFSFYELFKHPFITMNRGVEERNGKTYKVVHIIPTDKRSDFSIATVLIDTENERIVEAEMNTKNDGTYTLKMNFKDEYAILPLMIEIDFEIEHIKIPLKYMGKDAEIDKKQYKSHDLKTGKIFLYINYNDISYKS